MERKTGDFSERLKALRVANYMTQNQLAIMLHLSRTTISHYEQGIRFPDIRILMLISEQFQVSVDYLLFGKGKD